MDRGARWARALGMQRVGHDHFPAWYYCCGVPIKAQVKEAAPEGLCGCSPGPRGQGRSESGAELGAQGRSRREGLLFGAPAFGHWNCMVFCCRWVFHFQQRASLLGRVAGLAHSTILCNHFPGLASGWRLGSCSQKPPLPTLQLSVSHFLSSPFLPFLPQGHKRKFLCRVNAGRAGPPSPAVTWAPASMPSWPVQVVAAALSVASGALVLRQQALLLLQTLGLMFSSRNQFPLLVYNVPQG